MKNIDDLFDFEYGYLFYVVILFYYFERWKVEYDGSYFLIYKEKIEFCWIVQGVVRIQNVEGGEENFDEVVVVVFKIFVVLLLLLGLKEIFEYECINLVSYNFGWRDGLFFFCDGVIVDSYFFLMNVLGRC